MCGCAREVISGMDALILVVFVKYRVIENLELLFSSLKKSLNYVKC